MYKRFIDFLHKMGGLHDSDLTKIAIDLDKATATFYIDDLYANFLGFPEYPGPVSGEIIFDGLKSIETNLSLIGQLKIYETIPHEEKTNAVVFKISPHGSIAVEFSHVKFPEVVV
jgi:hypothetical protein